MRDVVERVVGKGIWEMVVWVQQAVRVAKEASEPTWLGREYLTSYLGRTITAEPRPIQSKSHLERALRGGRAILGKLAVLRAM